MKSAAPYLPRRPRVPGFLLVLDRLAGIVSEVLKYLAAAILVAIALLIAADVVARTVINQPLIGIAEIVANGVVLIAFLQLGYTVRVDGMLRSEAIESLLGGWPRRLLRVVGYLLGALLFGLIAWASWDGMITSIATREFEGHASFKVPTYPVRTAIVVFSMLAVLNYLLMVARVLLIGLPDPDRGDVGLTRGTVL